jgi:hypothetical protein
MRQAALLVYDRFGQLEPLFDVATAAADDAARPAQRLIDRRPRRD